MSSGFRVLGYARCSTPEQAAEGLSIEAQLARITAWAEATGAQLVELVVDEGVSGTLPLHQRDGGKHIADLIEARRPGVDAVVVARLDRLGRNAAETLTHLRHFTRAQLALVSVSERIDLSTPHGRAATAMSAVFAELERDLIALRTAEAIRHLRSQGRVYGPIPFGYRTVEDRLAPCPREQPILKRMQRMRARGMSYDRIAKRLNALGIRSKRGSRWYAMSVRSVLQTSRELQKVNFEQAVTTAA